MPHAYFNLLVHITFATRERVPAITSAIRADLHAYLGGICRNLNSVPINVGGVADHVHLLVSIPAKASVAMLIEKLKSNSSRWAHERGLRDLWWQRGYGAFSVSPGAQQRVSAYIENQEEHHKTLSFSDEFERLLIHAGVAFDRRFLFG